MRSRLLVLLVVLVAPLARADGLLNAPVGNADTFVSEGTKLFNRKQYSKAADLFLKATRAAPGNVPTYLLLARAQLLAKNIIPACYAYRTYLKVADPDATDRRKATAESEQCERLAAAQAKAQNDLLQKYVDTRAAFFTALDSGQLLGKEGAAASLEQLVKDGFLDPELANMGTRLGNAATAQADEIHAKALAGDKLTPAELRTARPLYQLAQDVGLTNAAARGRMAYLDGLAELSEDSFKKAEAHFAEAARSSPDNKEYVFAKALSLYRSGERKDALKVLEKELKDDPRTLVLRAALSLGNSPDAGAVEVEALLFETRVPPEK